ncbi:hypothetical protein C8F01DRAFT_971416 [Mycena amicta]|nr:hypothetical protein C8F01DRAFT_971416 [Mycena amicta]
MDLLDIPPELLIRILSFANIDSIRICEQTCTAFRTLIQSSVALQYILACGTASVVDNPQSLPQVAISDRLSLLRARESAFARMKPSWVCRVPVHFATAAVTELAGGLFCSGEEGRKAIHVLRLPVRPDETPEWNRLQVAHEAETSVFIDFNLAVEEHNMLMVAIYSWTGTNEASGQITLYPYCISTSQLHPLAKGPIEVMSSRLGQPHVTFEVVGDVVVAVVGFHDFGWAAAHAMGQHSDRVFVFEWKTGVLRKQIAAPRRSYYGLAFVSPDVIILPNLSDASLELWDISTSHSAQAPMLTLQMPHLSARLGIAHLTTRSQPNHWHGASREDTRRFPFSSDPSEAVVFFKIRYSAPETAYLLFIHRRTLLQMIQQHVSHFPILGPHTLPYTAWGASACRWIPRGDIVMETLIMNAGQRCVILERSIDIPSQVSIIDFNVHPSHVQQLLAAESSDTEEVSSGWEQMLPTDDADEHGAFEEPLGSRLPCYIRELAEAHDSFAYSRAGFDEARIIGFKVSLSV